MIYDDAEGQEPIPRLARGYHRYLPVQSKISALIRPNRGAIIFELRPSHHNNGNGRSLGNTAAAAVAAAPAAASQRPGSSQPK